MDNTASTETWLDIVRAVKAHLDGNNFEDVHVEILDPQLAWQLNIWTVRGPDAGRIAEEWKRALPDVYPVS